MTDSEREQLRRDERDLAGAIIHHWPAREIRVSLDCFSDQNARAAVKAAEEIAGNGKRVTVQTVLQQLTDSGAMEKTANGHGDFSDFLIGNPNAELSPAMIAADGLRKRVLAAAHRRAMRAVFAKAIEGLDAGEDPARIDAEIREASGKLQLHHSPPVWIQAKRPSDFKNWTPPEGAQIIGENHINLGSIFVIGGKAGVGKSLATTFLAIAGATGRDWFGLETHRKFKTLIIQNENGAFRLHQQFSALNCEHFDEHVLVTPPPPYGLAFDDRRFCADLKRIIADFNPDVIIIDPWNAVASDNKERDYSEAFKNIWSVIPQGDDSPAIGIVAHLRKSTEQKRGRSLKDEFSGSLKLTSVPRAAYVLQSASDDTEDDRVVFTCCMNNDGPEGQRSAWHRSHSGMFEPVADFDFETFDAGEIKPGVIDESTLSRIFAEHGPIPGKARLVQLLMDDTGKGKSSCYAAIKEFSDRITETGGQLEWSG